MQILLEGVVRNLAIISIQIPSNAHKRIQRPFYFLFPEIVYTKTLWDKIKSRRKEFDNQARSAARLAKQHINTHLKKRAKKDHV